MNNVVTLFIIFAVIDLVIIFACMNIAGKCSEQERREGKDI